MTELKIIKKYLSLNVWKPYFKQNITLKIKLFCIAKTANSLFVFCMVPTVFRKKI